MLKRLGKRLLLDDTAQASVEYMLILMITIGITISVIKKFLQPYLTKLADKLSTQIQASLFSKANMHTLRIGR